MMLTDPEFTNSIKNVIENDKYEPSYAVQSVVDQFVAMFEGMDNDYMRERAEDIRDIGKRLVARVKGEELLDLANLEDNTVIVAYDSHKSILKKWRGLLLK